MKKKIKLQYIVGIILTLAVVLGIEKFVNNSSELNSNEIFATQKSSDSLENSSKENLSIDQLTSEETVVNYLKAHHKLPAYYITKSEAKKNGWIPFEGNLCKVLPNQAIGGDYFNNREKKLPLKKGRKYFEADINYNCGRRGPERLVYSNDGLIFRTKDHYSTFQKR